MSKVIVLLERGQHLLFLSAIYYSEGSLHKYNFCVIMKGCDKMREMDVFGKDGGNKMKEKIVNVAQFIFEEYKKVSGQVIDEMKLHKLLYLTQRESFAVKGEAMFSEEFRGWKFGPVSLEVRSQYSEEGMKCKTTKLSEEDAYVARNVVAQYGGYESWKLSEMSHNELSWCNARKGIPDGENGNRVILLEDIQKDAEKIRPYDSVWDMYYDEFDDAAEEGEKIVPRHTDPDSHLDSGVIE